MKTLMFIFLAVLPLGGKSYKSDICVYGATASGVAASIQAARMGCDVILVAQDSHVGGMAASGLTATDINRHEIVGGIAAEFYHNVWNYYLDPSAWKNQTRDEFMEKTARRTFSGKNDAREIQWVYESGVGERIMLEMLREAGVRIVYGKRMSASSGVLRKGTAIRSVTMEDGTVFKASMFVDASYEGDLMAASGVSYTVERESVGTYGESLAGIRIHDTIRVSPYADGKLIPGVKPALNGPVGSADRCSQAYCYRVTLTDDADNRLPFTKPDGYDPSEYELVLRRILNGEKKEAKDIITFTPMPNRKTDTNHLDYIGASTGYADADWGRRDSMALAHRRYAEGMLWFLSSDTRVPPAIREEMSRWGYPEDEFCDNGHFPHQLYVREARRMVGQEVMTQADVDGKAVPAEPVGMGSYAMDCHYVNYVAARDCVLVEGGMFSGVKPYGIGYGAIVPKAEECSNLLVPVCMSASHVAYASLRMEPVYMVLGQSAAAAAVLAFRHRCSVQAVSYPELKTILEQCGQILQYSKAYRR
ncbi:MAG: FAD-dependent oxidoreductase [Candidatus Cryptobacteroides sp.]